MDRVASLIFILWLVNPTQGCPILQINAANYVNFCATAPPKTVKHFAVPCNEPICRKHFINCETPGDVKVMPCLPGLPWNGDGKVCYWQVRITTRSEACSDPGIDRSIRPCGTASIIVDGTERSLKERGHNVVLVDYRTGEFLESASFDLHDDVTAADAMATYFEAIPNETIVIVAAQDEAGKWQNSRSKAALASIGAKSGSVTYRQSFTIIGYKGNSAVGWITEVRHPPLFGPSEINDVNISLG